jgi:hypothetical protein
MEMAPAFTAGRAGLRYSLQALEPELFPQARLDVP